MAFGYTDNAESPHVAQPTRAAQGGKDPKSKWTVSYQGDFSSFFFPPVPLQFDLQRIVIYCDSRHAELETCCDIPSGPVSLHADWAGDVYGVWDLSVQGLGISS